MKDEDFIIKRVSKPQQLKVKYKSQEFQGESAQNIIENIIGSNYAQFCLCTMITSNLKSSLATITPGDRFNVIRELTSTLNEPKRDFEKIKSYESSLKSQLDVAAGEINVLQEQLTHKIDKVEFDADHYQALQSEYKDLEKQCQKYSLILADNKGLDVLLQRLDDLEYRPLYIEKIKKFKQYLTFATHLSSVENTKQQFEDGKVAYFLNLQRQLKELKSKEYDEDQLKRQTRECSLRENCESELAFADVKEIQDELKNRTQAHLKTNKQKCPACKKLVTIDNDKVVQWKTAYNKISVNKDDLQQLQKVQYPYNKDACDLWDEAVQTRLRIKEIERILDKQILSNELIRLRKSFGDLAEPEGYKSKYAIEYLNNRLQELNQKVGSIPEPEKGEYNKIKKQIKALKKMKCAPTVAQLKKMTAKKNKLMDNIQDLQDKRDSYKEYQQYIKIDEQLNESQSTQRKLLATLNRLERLKKIQRESEIMSMQQIVDTINVYSAQYLEMFFDEPIDVTLTLIKKTAKNTKLSLEMSTVYRNEKFDISEFSQGEVIKINLAFILAMNKLQSSKYLFLDEILQNLDKKVQMDVYNCLKEIKESVSIFVIDHNAIQGCFDEIVQF